VPVPEEEQPLSQEQQGPTDEEFLRIPPSTDDPLSLMPPQSFERAHMNRSRRRTPEFSLFSDDEETEEEARRRRPIIRVARSTPAAQTLTNPHYEDDEAVDTENGPYDT
jgi:hypothetical protein